VVDDPELFVGGAALRILDGAAPRVVGCHFEGNEVGDPGWGGAIYANLSSPAFLDNVVEGNTSMWADGGGVHVCVDCRPHANPIVIANDIIDNEGLYHGAGGIGAAYLRVFRHNNVHGNTTQGEPADLGWFNELLDEYPAWVTDPDLSKNWWGTTDMDAIEDAVFHGGDDPIYGVAQLEPIAEQARIDASPWAAITCREIRFASVGQEMPVYLTLYNPGAADVDVLVALGLTYGDRVRMPYSGPLDLPGAEATAAGHRLTLPAGTVTFTELMRPSFDGDPGLGSGTWHAVLADGVTGQPITEALSAHFVIGEGE